MAKGALTIRRQIKSISNTKKMTKAMELVSAAKMRRSVAAAAASRPYAVSAEEVVSYLMPRIEKNMHPLLAERPVRRVGIIAIGTNRGLCGGFNANLAAAAHGQIARLKSEGVHIELYTLGRRIRDYCMRYGHSITADFPKEDITRSVTDILPLASVIIRTYSEGALDRVFLVFTEFLSTVRQQATVRQLLPFGAFRPLSEEKEELLSQVVFEPSPSDVVSHMLPRILETHLYQAVLDSEASEHSARMLAMHNASEAATDMLSDLRLTYNQARQAAITQEIAEISSGKAALE